MHAEESRPLTAGRVLIYTLLVLMALYYLAPLYVMLTTSFKTLDEVRSGNLLDLPFDGQSAITARGAGEPLQHYIGNSVFVPGTDDNAYQGYIGGKPAFLALAPWVTADADRATLIATGAALSPGSNDPMENDYLETAVWADLTR